MNDSSDAKSRSRRCHNLWHVPRSNWMRRESTGAHFTLKLPDSGRTSVGRARFKSPLAHTPRSIQAVQPSHAAPAFMPPNQIAAAMNGSGTTHSGLRLIQTQPRPKSTSQTPMKTPTA